MQAIKTKFLPATDTRPTRVKAEAPGGSVTIPATQGAPHALAVLALAGKLDWHGAWIGGTLKDGERVWVAVPGWPGIKGNLESGGGFISNAIDPSPHAIRRVDAENPKLATWVDERWREDYGEPAGSRTGPVKGGRP